MDLLSDFLKGNIHCIVMIAVIHAQRSNKAVQCPNCVQTLFRITFIQITQDIYRTGQMSFHFLQWILPLRKSESKKRIDTK